MSYRLEPLASVEAVVIERAPQASIGAWTAREICRDELDRRSGALQACCAVRKDKPLDTESHWVEAEYDGSCRGVRSGR